VQAFGIRGSGGEDYDAEREGVAVGGAKFSIYREDGLESCFRREVNEGTVLDSSPPHIADGAHVEIGKGSCERPGYALIQQDAHQPPSVRWPAQARQQPDHD
jgi:hypothetical protein